MVSLGDRVLGEAVEVAEKATDKKKILLVYEKVPNTFWSFDEALEFIGKKSSHPPLGLITIAPMIPDEYEVEVVDLNVEELSDKKISDAYLLLSSSMVVQQESLEETLGRANRLGTRTVVGGPFPTQYFDKIKGADHFIIGEAESGGLDAFFRDLKAGDPKKVYARPPSAKELISLEAAFSDQPRDIKLGERPDIKLSPIPRYDLIDVKAYSSMSIQFTRGCPYDCEFCSQTTLGGRNPRTKTAEQVVAELEAMYASGYRGSVFFVDDNFIGNKKEAGNVLESIIEFQKEKGYPFSFYTESSTNLSDNEELMNQMREAGFKMVFLGIESPDPDTQDAVNKIPNKGRDLMESVRKIQSNGISVTAGFIVGDDTDKPGIYDATFDFCQKAGIPTSMVGLLIAARGARLYDRLKEEGRLLEELPGGSNTHDFSLNFIPAEGRSADEIIGNYKNLLSRLYGMDGKNYFDRCRVLLDNLGKGTKEPFTRTLSGLTFSNLDALVKSFFKSPSKEYQKEYRKFLWDTLRKHPTSFGEAVGMGIIGQHFALITNYAIGADDLRNEILETQYSLLERAAQLIPNFNAPDISMPDLNIQTLRESLKGRITEGKEGLNEFLERTRDYLVEKRNEINKLPKDYRLRVQEAYDRLGIVFNNFVGKFKGMKEVELYS